MRTFIGIHDGHNASVAVVRGGRIELALQEERLTRTKNQGDAPSLAARAALDVANGSAAGARVGLNGLYLNYRQWQRETILRDYERSSGVGGRVKQTLKGSVVDRVYQRYKRHERTKEVERLGFPHDSIEPVEHHQAHAAAAYFGSPWREGKTLVLTCDGLGDRLSATVNIAQRGEIQRIAEVSEHDSIGRLYSLVTHWMGMTPLEHEYKVMGLAPYVAGEEKIQSAARWFEELFEFTSNPLVWRRKRGVPSMYAAREFLGKLLTGRRFDLVAAGVQRFLETMLSAWVRNAVRETGIRRVACAGGVFMNVKANLVLAELPEVEELFVFPSCGDESNAIGAACWLASRAGENVDPIGPIYYGDPITDEGAQEALDAPAGSGKLRAQWVPDMEAKVAAQLAEGRIVARAKGRMEFGARALGNRSILAPADRPETVRVINEMVKSRDFWMPFAPSVLASRADEYYGKPKPVPSPYMMLAFRSRPSKRGAYPAAQHPYDGTTRPHEVFESHNADYWRLLKEYEGRTGEGIVLNTSFNLHGEPIVYHAREAVDVFLRSGLDRMALGNWWVEKT